MFKCYLKTVTQKGQEISYWKTIKASNFDYIVTEKEKALKIFVSALLVFPKKGVLKKCCSCFSNIEVSRARRKYTPPLALSIEYF